MTISRVLAFPGAYRDSLLLLGDPGHAGQRGRELGQRGDGHAGRGGGPGGPRLRAGQLAGADANALVLAVEAGADPAASLALDRGRALLFAETGHDEAVSGRRDQPDPRTVGEAARLLPAANVAVVSVPGQYAAIAAHSALTAGMHVLLFSDNVTVADEVALKQRAAGGLLVMGRVRVPPCSAASASASPTRSARARWAWSPPRVPGRRRS